MNSYTFHINLYDLAFLGAIFTGLTFALQLWFTKTVNRSANRFLALALATMILWMIRILAIDLKLETYLPRWDWLPMQFLLALGPLMYFYVLKITRRQYKFGLNDLLHFSPLLLEQAALVLEIRESGRTGTTTYVTHTFQQLNPVLQPLVFISIITYLHLCNKRIQQFYTRQPITMMDRSRIEFRWLRRLLAATALLWLLWLVCAAINYFGYHNQTIIQLYYPFYIFFAVIIIWTAAAAFLKPQAAVVTHTAPVKQPVQAELRQKGAWLKRAMEANQYYQDPETSLGSLAEKLKMPPHELSRVINTVFKKGFNDFINEYRVRDMVSKMKDPAYDNMTLLGIAFEAGFNSQSTFNRIFKQLTGKSAAEFKNSLKKEHPYYNLSGRARFAPVISHHQTTSKWPGVKLNRNYMFRNYCKTAWRNITKSKLSAGINIGGLAIGMAVALFIGLWVNEERSFNQYHTNYPRIAQVLEKNVEDGETSVIRWVPYPLEAELKNKYGSNFKQVVLTMGSDEQILTFGNKSIFQVGKYMQPGGPEMLSLSMLKGSRGGLKDPSSILLSASASRALFGKDEPIGKTLQINNRQSVQVTGVYEDIPYNSDFKDVQFIAPWDLLAANTNWIKNAKTEWGNTSFLLYVELQPNTTMEGVSARIKNAKADNTPVEAHSKCEILLDPMKNWHLYSEWKNGVNTGGRIQYVWLFGIIGGFVLILACINFMNLSTARSEKRAKEVGIRKAVGSMRTQLVKQFLTESLLVSALASIIAFVLVFLGLPWFNTVAGAQISFPLQNPLFWLANIGFVLFTGLLAGSYPALYLSSFRPVKVLKGTFSAGRFASLFRQSLTVVQFSVSIALIIGIAFVYRQVQYVKDRPVGYDRNNLLMVRVKSAETAGKLDLLKTTLENSGAVAGVATSSSPLTAVWATGGGFSWKNMAPNAETNFAKVWISQGFGKTVGWQFTAGRDFSASLVSDSMPAQSNTGVAYSIVINEAAAKNMGLRNPVGETIRWNGQPLIIIGVIKDMIMQSPYEPVKQTIYLVNQTVARDWVNIRLQPGVPTAIALAKIGGVFKMIAPSVPFEYKFADTEYGLKFLAEERVQKLASVFGVLAIFISCLGLFGLASFIAEKRTREIGVRKVLGASVFSVWQLMSADFIKLVLLSCLVAVPVAYIFIYRWLQNYPYHTTLAWWVFALAAASALVIALLTVSYRSIKTGLMNPVKALRVE